MVTSIHHPCKHCVGQEDESPFHDPFQRKQPYDHVSNGRSYAPWNSTEQSYSHHTFSKHMFSYTLHILLHETVCSYNVLPYLTIPYPVIYEEMVYVNYKQHCPYIILPSTLTKIKHDTKERNVKLLSMSA